MEHPIILTEDQKHQIKKRIKIAALKYLHQENMLTDEQLNTLLNKLNN
jgi:ribosome assembly protein YihI (activator of Der GTPase)